jgi:alkylated DNA nucleotide flippase Atl1
MDEPSAKEKAVLDVVETIPRGFVMSYGDVADRAGLGSARFVGQALARWGDEVAWQRVVMSDGSFAKHLAREQQELLRAEGTPLTGDGKRVNMRSARFA